MISVPYLLGDIALTMGDQEAVDRNLPCLSKLWQAQLPTAVSENRKLSNSFLFVMEENPQAFFSAMGTQPDVFTSWLRELPKLSFTSAHSSACIVEARRKRTLDFLQNTRVVGTKEQSS
jgi:hypothetical protein